MALKKSSRDVRGYFSRYSELHSKVLGRKSASAIDVYLLVFDLGMAYDKPSEAALVML